MTDATVEFVGSATTTVEIPNGIPVVEHRIGFECSSGEWIERDYRGVRVDRVLEAVPVPEETTHLVVSADDGHVACPAIWDALDGLLATGERRSPRFVAPGIAGPRAIKGVERIEAIVLASEAEPESLERIPPDAEE